jgi:hypothetical protein
MYSACIFSSAVVALLVTAYGVIITKTTHITSLHFDAQIAHHQHPLLTQVIQQALNQITEKNFIIPINSSAFLFTEIKKEFPGLTHLRINQQTPGNMKINLSVDTPFLKIHHTNSSPLVLLNLGDYAPVQHYEQDFLDDLATVLITEPNFNKEAQETLSRWARKAPENFFRNYSVCWNNKNDILISNPDDQHFEYCSTTTTEYLPNLEKNLTTLRELHLEKVGDKKANKKWRIDLRFKDQYIVTEKNNVLQKKSVTKGRGCV